MLLESSLGCFLYMPPQHLFTLNLLVFSREWRNGIYYIRIMVEKMEATTLKGYVGDCM